MLTAVSAGGSSTSITGSLNSRNNNGAGRTYRLEFFSNPTPSQSGFGEGQTFIGFMELTLGNKPVTFARDQASNTASFTAVLNFQAPIGKLHHRHRDGPDSRQRQHAPLTPEFPMR